MGNQGVNQHIQHDYSFNLTGIVPPQPPKWKQVDHLYKDFKKFKRSCTHVFDGPMAHVSDKVKVNMLLLWCSPDGEDIYEGFNLPVHQQYDLDLIWSLFDKHCEPICNFSAVRWKFRTVAQAPSETHLIIGFLSWLSSVNLNQWRRNQD